MKVRAEGGFKHIYFLNRNQGGGEFFRYKSKKSHSDVIYVTGGANVRLTSSTNQPSFKVSTSVP